MISNASSAASDCAVPIGVPGFWLPPPFAGEGWGGGKDKARPPPQPSPAKLPITGIFGRVWMGKLVSESDVMQAPQAPPQDLDTGRPVVLPPEVAPQVGQHAHCFGEGPGRTAVGAAQVLPP